ncbi:MAG: 50S ribosomal protein L9 [FCB group bacterium]|nr:50S ribosomal protein L9 [FCB group bacterium]
MEIILTSNVESLGKTGDIVTVKPGYARNYLFPKGLAKKATASIIDSIRKQVEQEELREAKVRANLEALATRLDKLTLKFTMKSGEDDKLFGSVTSAMIADAIVAKGYPIDKKEVEMPEPIRHVGNHFVIVKLGGGLEGRVKIKVAAEK